MTLEEAKNTNVTMSMDYFLDICYGSYLMGLSVAEDAIKIMKEKIEESDVKGQLLEMLKEDMVKKNKEKENE